MRLDEDDLGGLTRFAENSGNGFGVSADTYSKEKTPANRVIMKILRIFTARLIGF
jgi:hypothetical protein